MIQSESEVRIMKKAHYDSAATATSLMRAKGPQRTMKEFSDVTGINKSTLSRIANQQYSRPLSAALISKIYHFRADPDDVSLLGDLFAANGFLSVKDADSFSLERTNALELSNLENIIGGILANFLLEKKLGIERKSPFFSSYALVQKKLLHADFEPYILTIRDPETDNTRQLRVIPCLRRKKEAHQFVLDSLYPFLLEDSCYFAELSNFETYFVFDEKSDLNSFLNDGGIHRWHHAASAILIDLHSFSVTEAIDLPAIGVHTPI